MKEKVLSQDEVDALLGGVESGEIVTGKGRRGGGEIKPYNFLAQERVIRGKMRGLEMANDKFTRLFRNSLSSVIMKFIDVRINNFEMIAFSEFMKTMPVPSSLNIFKMEPLKGLALFVIEAPMVFALIEYFFGGGANRYVKSEGRYFTSIEQRVIKKIAAMALDDLAAAWEGMAPIRPEYLGLEMNPQFATIVTATEAVVKIDVEIEVEDFTGKAFFCIPYSMVEPIKDRLYTGIHTERQGADQEWVASLKDALKGSFVSLSVEIGRAELSLADLMDLEVGSVISLGKPVSEGLLVKVQDVPKLTCMPGHSRGNQAIKIKKFI
jgi:flagellar motor switch protein FliM